ncbi:aldo/keto reductase family protein [Bifidobacterium eulemuris]|uniref:Aldo/keto reductase family protein n=1 Tax=Bifidobacterium eulemuris TaxID=1765219 RepID=A0A261GCS2_9BIFI|nr:aldo/keto reductase family protein [Bifidobacterium eulemuris]OZG68945.1 voltage-gated potassium channel [Bifidobacterium eulemuris]QOL31519.1 aldo/keto reductase family protein [Bifidobacterium eulemuris]
MKYRNVGKSGLKVSEVALGSWVTDLNGTAAADVARRTVDLAFDNGVNFFDCADAYSGGAAERFFGDVLARFPRRELVVSSKVYFPTGPGVNDRGLSRKHIFESCEQSLNNMKLDYLDLYYCHRFDETCDLEETLRALSDLVSQGKILYYGVSEEWGGARLQEAQRIIERLGLHPLTVVQPQYNLADRYIEHEIMDVCVRLGIGITTFSPLSQGLLTGKYRKGRPIPEGSRATWQADRQINDMLTDENLDMVERLIEVADGLGVNLAIMSMAWILQHPQVSCVIAGASKPSQLENNIKASGFVIPDDAMVEIDRITGFQRFERHVG